MRVTITDDAGAAFATLEVDDGTLADMNHQELTAFLREEVQERVQAYRARLVVVMQGKELRETGG